MRNRGRRSNSREADLRDIEVHDGEALESALQAAERLLAQGEERRRDYENRTFAIISLMIGIILSGIAAVIASPNSLAVAPAAGTFLIVAVLLWVLARQRRRMQLDYTLQIAGKLGAIVGESYLEIADDEKWSVLQHESVRLRLAAFPLYSPNEHLERVE